MIAGRLNRKVTIQEPTEAADAVNDPVQTWSTYCVRSAAIEPLNGREFFAAQQEQAEVSTRMRLRYDSKTKDITAKMRVSYDSRIFRINTIIRPRENHREIILMCLERDI